MNRLHLTLALAMAAGLSGCETALSGPMAGRISFVTDGASSAADAVSARESCLIPAPAISTVRNIGNTAALSDATPGGEGC